MRWFARYFRKNFNPHFKCLCIILARNKIWISYYKVWANEVGHQISLPLVVISVTSMNARFLLHELHDTLSYVCLPYNVKQHLSVLVIYGYFTITL